MELSLEQLITLGGAVLATFLLLFAFGWKNPKGKKGKYTNYRSWQPKVVANGENPSPRAMPFGDNHDLLRIVSDSSFSKRKLLSKTEARVFAAVEKALDELQCPWRVMAQVSLGEILSSSDNVAYRAINSKRVDILLVANDHSPIAAVEYQGSGHHLGDASARDAIKKEALRRAGIGYIEVVEGDDPKEVRNLISRFIKVENLKKA